MAFDLAAMESAVAQHDLPDYCTAILRRSEAAFRHFIDFLAERELQRQESRGQAGATAKKSFESIQKELRLELEAGSMPEAIRDPHVWIVYLHIYALSGRGRVDEDHVAHTNVRASYPGHRSSTAGSSRLADVSVGVQNTPDSIRPIGRLPQLSADLSLSSAQMESMRSNFDNEELDDMDMASIDGEGSGSAPVLAAADLQMARKLPRPIAGSTPLAIGTIKCRFNDIVRHLMILGIKINEETRSNVVRIIEHLGREGYYPTGQLKKFWITDDTVAALSAAVWNVLGTDVSSTGARSVANLLSLHTMVLLLDQCGGRITSWVDMQREPGEVGRYLRWSMLSFKFLWIRRQCDERASLYCQR